jgi:hypothetical protein
LPFGKNFTGAKKMALDGWQTNMVMVWNSGSPFTLTDNFSGRGNSEFVGVGGGPTRPNKIAPSSVPDPNNAQWFNRNAFVIPPAGTIGNVARNSMYGPQFRHFDFSLFKNFAVTERFKLQFRSEFFNAN